jgi:hypothetical protein
MPTHELETRGPIRPGDRGPEGIPPQDLCHQSRSSCLESRYEAVREASKRVVEREAKDVSGAAPNRGTLETPSPWRTEFRNRRRQRPLQSGEVVPVFHQLSRMRPGSSRLALVCTAGQGALSSGQVNEMNAPHLHALQPPPGGTESTGRSWPQDGQVEKQRVQWKFRSDSSGPAVRPREIAGLRGVPVPFRLFRLRRSKA